MGDALHSMETLQAGRALRLVAGSLGVAVAELTCVATYVENTDDTHTTRLSVLGPDGALQAGLCFQDLHEPEVLVDKLDLLLGSFGCAPVHQLTQTYFSVEADEDLEKPRFLVPGQGWQHPPAQLSR